VARRRRDVWFFIGAVILLLYCVFLLYPLVGLLLKSVRDGSGGFSAVNFHKFFSRKYYYGAILNSLKVTTAVTLLSVLVAMPLAYIMNTVRIRFAGAVQILILISMVSPPFIGAYSWILLAGRNGVVTNLFKGVFGVRLPDIYGFGGIALVLTLQMIPLVYMYVSGALKNVDSSIFEAAESLGCSGFRKIIKVVIPIIMPTLLASGLLVFMRALADFGTPMLLGEGYRTVPSLIYNEFMGEVSSDKGFAAAISVMVVVFATTIFIVQQYVSRKKSFQTSSMRPVEAKKVKGLRSFLFHLYVYMYVALAMAPQFYVIYTSFLNTSGRLFVPGYGLESYRTAFSKIGNSITNTIVLALISLVIIISIAVMVAYITVRRRGTAASVLNVATMFPYIVPGSALGIALLLTFNRKPILLSGTAAIMVLSFVIRRLAYTVRSTSALLQQLSVSTEEAAVSLGASQMKTFFRVTLPALLPGVFSGAILTWITILTELSTSILLYVVSTRTMTVAIYTEVLRGNYGTAAALSTVLSAITIVSLLIFYKLTGKREVIM